MTDHEKRIREALEMVDRAVYIDDSGNACLNASFNDEQLQAALSAAKAGGWVAVQSEPWGWAIVSNDGTTKATRARIRDFFGSHLEMPPYMQAEIDQVDREWAGLAPHRVVTLYALPAPPAQRGEG